MTSTPLYSAADAAQLLGIDRSRVLRIATTRGLGRKPGYSGRTMWLFTAADVEAMRERKPGRPTARPAAAARSGSLGSGQPRSAHPDARP